MNEGMGALLVGSNSEKEIGKRYIGSIQNGKTQQWVDNVPYVILEQVTEEEFSQYCVEELGFELANCFRGAYYYRISVD